MTPFVFVLTRCITWQRLEKFKPMMMNKQLYQKWWLSGLIGGWSERFTKMSMLEEFQYQYYSLSYKTLTVQVLCHFVFTLERRLPTNNTDVDP